jgi:endoglucanase
MGERDDSIALLRALTQADGVPGFEGEVRAIFEERLAPHGELTRNGLGGVVCKKRGSAERPRVMLDCHLDEVGFIVQHITPGGFLKFLALGGWSGQVLPAQRVRVWAPGAAGGRGAKIDGVIGSTPPHLMPADKRDKVPDLRDLFIDVGASSRAEAEAWGIRAGTWAVPASPFTPLANPARFLAKAFDNRAGCGVCIETTTAAASHPNTIFASGSAQEEVGLRGAATAARLIEPDVAIVLEGPPADDTPGFSADESQGGLGRGVQIRAYDPTMIANPRLFELALDTARREGIPHQVSVRSSGGTDGGAIHTSARGVPAIVLGVPARYIHAHASIIDIDDYLACKRLVLALLNALDADRVAAL